MLSNDQIDEKIQRIKNAVPTNSAVESVLLAEGLDLVGSLLKAVHNISYTLEQLEMNTRQNN